MLALEVVEVPVSNIDSAKAFYEDVMGFHLDVDYAPTPHFRVVQLTPPGSAENMLAAAQGQTFCPYKGLCSYYDIGSRARAAWSYLQAWPEVARISNFVSFEADQVDVSLDGHKLSLEPGQTVVPHGIDRGLDPDEILNRDKLPQP